MIVKTDNQYYCDIASAIREKNETNTKYKPSEMAIAIENIESGGIQCTLSISTTPNANVTATFDGTTVSAKADVSGIATLELPEEGVWTVTATADGQSVSIQVNTSFSLAVGLNFFPAEPSSYEYMALITSSQTWTASETGWFQIEALGASGNGGDGLSYNSSSTASSRKSYSGGGGGGGGCACSRVKMNKGDTIALTVGAVGATTIAVINSSVESYSSPQVTSGANGTAARSEGSLFNKQYFVGTGGTGGTASGGNYSNSDGGIGGDGRSATGTAKAQGGTGGTGANGAPNGGVGGMGSSYNPELIAATGSAGFIKIYRGNTNIA